MRMSRLISGSYLRTKCYGNVNRRATLCFTQWAYKKMRALVEDFDSEIAWHGVAKRGEDVNEDKYVIFDILVYPQEVTNTSVEMDTSEYARWIQKNAYLPGINDIRMQGHSHVNMGVFPSLTDLKHQEDILREIPSSDFYIFLIWNKKNDKMIQIFDFAKNLLFETEDVTLKVLNDGSDEAPNEAREPWLVDFLNEARSMVRERGIIHEGE